MMIRLAPPEHWQRHRRNPLLQVACLFGAGLIQPAPGTWGTLAAALPGFALALWLPPGLFLAFIIALIAVGYAACRAWEREIGVKDDGRIVIDEAVAIGLVYAPLGFHGASVGPIGYAVGGFALFRLLDILKPWPIGWLERRIMGAWGVMIDDLVAALVTIAILQLIIHF